MIPPSVFIRSRLESTGYPVFPILDELCVSLASRHLAVLTAAPGAGKSTLVPLALLGRSEFNTGKILLLEPRRLAAVATAGRLADLLGEEVGKTVGYSVRLERKVGPDTRIEVLTEGLLTRRLEADPGLTGVSTVIFDEFHERSVHSDLALALCLDLRRLVPDLSLLLMSATMDSARVAGFLARASGGERVPIIDAPGRQYPVAIEYEAPGSREWVGEAAARCIAREIASGRETGDILAFFPGKREIEDARAALSRRLERGTASIFTLHGSMPLSAQRELFSPLDTVAGKCPVRVILSTNIAETSLTVPGIRLVVDTGLVRLERYHISSALDRLSLEKASIASTDQRAGRAGRLAAGRCIRLWDQSEPRPRETESEILRTELSSLVLDCALWGVRESSALDWLDPPPEAAWKTALDLLVGLGALDRELSPTQKGERMARLGLSPRLAALVLEGERQGPASQALAVAAAAILSDRDGSGIGGDADFRRRLALVRDLRSEDGAAAFPWRDRTLRLARDILSRLGNPGLKLGWGLEEEASVGSLLSTSFPDRVARRQESGIFRFPSGREGRIDGPLAAADWIVTLEADAGERSGVIYLAAPLDAHTALTALKPLSREDRAIEWKGLVPRTVSRLLADRLLLREKREKSHPEELPSAFSALLGTEGLSVLPWNDDGGKALRFLSRARFFEARRSGDSLCSDEALLRDAEEVFGPFLKADGGPVLDAAGLCDALRSRFDWKTLSELDARVPDRFITPAGSSHPILYEDGKPRLEVRIQEIFGLSDTPRVMGERILLHLLSPANRPLQLTEDLAGFWQTTWPEVRKEMRGRYPRHYWPEDPLVAEPTTRAKKRGT